MIRDIGIAMIVPRPAHALIVYYQLVRKLGIEWAAAIRSTAAAILGSGGIQNTSSSGRAQENRKGVEVFFPLCFDRLVADFSQNLLCSIVNIHLTSLLTNSCEQHLDRW